MSLPQGKRRLRLLGVGFDAADGHVRITQGEGYDVLMGSEQSHAYMAGLVRRIEEELFRRGKVFDCVEPSEIFDIVRDVK